MYIVIYTLAFEIGVCSVGIQHGEGMFVDYVLNGYRSIRFLCKKNYIIIV